MGGFAILGKIRSKGQGHSYSQKGIGVCIRVEFCPFWFDLKKFVSLLCIVFAACHIQALTLARRRR